ncbi:MAG: chromosome segregation protein SMC [Tissierellia bacterium]|nr:chromosome segregation protein SMC [Tissierellia bacterium]
MFLKSIELKGFKSFADRTHIDFLPGVTCIVGPNGCGKSNIIDAIRWVLGEQSSTSLRARRMEDVIFSGTKHRAAQNFASVKLIFSQAQEISPGGSEELSVERILHRSGESTYKINSQAVRLKDLRQLFMDTAVGVSGYSLISQGDIDDILKENKQERRKIFEEASGISLIHYKKEEAKRRLARVEDSYVRLMDILKEIEERRDPLLEERDRAIEYLKLSERARNLDLFYAKEDYSAYEAQEAELSRELGRLNYDLEGAFKEKDKLTEKREANRQQASSLEAEFSLFQDLLRDKSKLRDDYYLELRIKEERLRQLQREKESLDRDQDGMLDGVSGSSLETSEKRLEETNKRLDKLASEIGELSKLIDLRSRDIKELRLRKDELDASRAELRLRLEQMESNKAELIRLEGSSLASKNELEEELASLESYKKKLADQEASLTRKLIGLKRTREELDLSKQELEESRSFLIAKRAEIATQISSLEKNIELYEKWEMEGDRELESYRKDIGGEILYKKLRPRKGFEKALEAALGQAINSLDIRGGATNLQASGVNLLYELPGIKKPVDKNSMGLLGDFVEGPKELVQGLLSNYLIYKNLDEALKGPKDQVRITLDGQRLDQGFYFPWDSAPSPLEISLKLEENTNEKTQLISQLEKLDRDIKENFDSIGESRRQEEAFLAEEEMVLREERDFKESKSLLASREEITSFKYGQFKESLEGFSLQIEGLRTGIKAIKAQLDGLESENSKLQGLLDNDREDDLEELQESFLELRLEEAGAKEEAKRWQAELESLRLQNLESKRREELRVQRIKEQEKETQELNKEIDSYREDYSAAQLEIKKLDKQAFGLKKELDQLREVYAASEKRRESLDAELFKIQEEKNKKEIGLGRLEERKSALSQEIWDRYELSMLQVKDLNISCDEPRQNRKKIRREMANLEPVNLKAPEEFEELDQRYSFLQEQLVDIENSKADLNRTILSLERKMKEEFIESFEAIRENFKEIFSHLFRGGQGDIMLEDPEEVLTSDIIILASPPGKKLQHMNLLSGGEKALTAIALLFAVLKTKPAPFYVLDEIEAALDDINIQRFGTFLEEFSLGSQFILITHRKGTMEFADALYGVSMEEKGVSSLISLKMEE